MTVEEVKALLQESNEEDYKKAREKIDTNEMPKDVAIFSYGITYVD